MKRILWAGAIVIVLLALAALFGRAILEQLFPNERKIWELVESGVDGVPVEPAKDYDLEEWRSLDMGPKLQTGYLRFADGEIWRYSFVPYAHVGGTNSFSIYKGANETWRLKGSRFCCEIFPGAEQPKDAGEFRAMLKKTGEVFGGEP